MSLPLASAPPLHEGWYLRDDAYEAVIHHNYDKPSLHRADGYCARASGDLARLPRIVIEEMFEREVERCRQGGPHALYFCLQCVITRKERG